MIFANISKFYNTALFLITLLLSLFINLKPPVWEGYGDPYDYLNQSKESLFSVELYAPNETEQYSSRPFTVPLLYKIAGSQAEQIIILQKFIHAISMYILCYAIMLFLNSHWSKLIMCTFIYLLMSWWNVLGWTNTLLSESLSTSLLFIWLGTLLILIKSQNIFMVVFHTILTVLLSFTRDSWPYTIILLHTSTLMVCFFLKSEQKVIKIISGLVVFSFILFFVQQKTADLGQRYRLPVMNNIVFRILPNQDYTDWFIKQGMPDVDLLKSKYGNMDNWKLIYPLYKDSSLINFSHWITKNGRSTYTKFLLTHPKALFLGNEDKTNLQKILSYNIGYTGDVKGFSINFENIFPFFGIISILILNVILLLIHFKTCHFIHIFPTLLIIVFGLNAWLLMLADSIEIERHLYGTNIMIQFLGILILCLIFDSIITRHIFKPKQL